MRHFFGDEVAGRFLHGNLAAYRRRHVVSVPMQAPVIVAIEKVHLATGRPHIRMQPNEFQQCSRAALLHADYQDVGQLPIQLIAILAEQSIFGHGRLGRCSDQRHIHDNRINKFDFEHFAAVYGGPWLGVFRCNVTLCVEKAATT